jgi:hypothetical protein
MDFLTHSSFQLSPASGNRPPKPLGRRMYSATPTVERMREMLKPFNISLEIWALSGFHRAGQALRLLGSQEITRRDANASGLEKVRWRDA